MISHRKGHDDLDNWIVHVYGCCFKARYIRLECLLNRLFVLLLLLFSATSSFAGERILALAPHACEMLFAIGANKDIVGAVSYCDYPKEAGGLSRVGAYNRINVEAAIALHPTMAIVMDEQTPGVEQLRDLGVAIVRSYPQRVDEVFSDIRRIGKITGHAVQAEQVAHNLEERLQFLETKVAHHHLNVFYEIWAEPLLTAGKHTFIHDVLKRIGLINVFGSLEQEAPRVNVESVLHSKPQLVIVPSEKRDISARTKYWQTWLGKDIQVITVNPDLLHRPGPRLLDGMEDLVRQLEILYVAG